MKRLNIEGREFLYKVVHDGLYRKWAWTEFYHQLKISHKRKYVIFGPKIEIYEPIIAFKIPYSIEDQTQMSVVENDIKTAYHTWVLNSGIKEKIQKGFI